MSFRLYGRGQGNGSHAVVTRGFREVLTGLGELDGFVPLDLPEDEYAPWPGALAKHGVHTGDLKWLLQMTHNARHEHRWSVVAPNSNYMPVSVVKALHDAKITCLAPSQWAAKQLQRYELPSIVVHHGVQGLSTVGREHVSKSYEDGRFVVLHLSSTATLRKGTDQLIKAWISAREKKWLPSNAVLFCVLDPDADQALRLRLIDDEIQIPQSVIVGPRGDFSPFHLSNLLEAAHVVCQPSRSEAFGMVPLEALASGVPVVATTCTGHSAFMFDRQGLHRQGTVPVVHSDDAPIDDGPDAVAPGVMVEWIAHALKHAHEHWKELNMLAQKYAGEVREEWSWQKQLGPWISGCLG